MAGNTFQNDIQKFSYFFGRFEKMILLIKSAVLLNIKINIYICRACEKTPSPAGVVIKRFRRMFGK